MGDQSEAWRRFNELRNERAASKKRQVEIDNELAELIKKIESSKPQDDDDRIAKKAYDEFEPESGDPAKPVLQVPPKTGDVLKDIDTKIGGSKEPPKGGSSSGGSSGI